MHKIGTLGCFLALTGFAFAHQGVTNPTVMARMDLMSSVAKDMKVIGEMVKGTVPYDADAAKQSAGNLIRHAEATPKAFEAEEQDPKSEALDVIWTDWDGFTKASVKMKTEAEAVLAAADDQSELSKAFIGLGQSCKACHKTYRIEK